MIIKIKKLSEEASIPKYAKEGDAGLDLVAIDAVYIENEVDPDYIEYSTGLSIEIPEGYVGLIFPRSSNSKKNLNLCNSVGVVDSGYRGEIKLRYKIDIVYEEVAKFDKNSDYTEVKINNESYYPAVYKVGDKVGQLVIMPYPVIELQQVEELSSSERGEKGFGSTGN